MLTTAEIVDALIRFHFKGEDEEKFQHIAMVIRLHEAGIAAQAPAGDDRVERKRKYDRDRLRVLRGQSPEAPNASNDHESCDSRDSTEMVSPKKIPPYNPLKKLPLPEKNKTAVPFPADWKPNEAALALGRTLRLDATAVSVEASRFAAWAAATDQRKTDWNSCFEFWLRNGKPKAFKASTVADKPSVVTPIRQMVFVMEGSPQWLAWVRAGHKPGLKRHEAKGCGWWFDSEWPDKYRHENAGNSQPHANFA